MAREDKFRKVNDLPQLQNLIKRDSESYKYEFLTQLRAYQGALQAFLLKPSRYDEELSRLVHFVGQVAYCYPEESSKFPEEIVQILQKHATVLDPTMRLAMCKALILIRNKGLIQATQLLELFFKLFRCQDRLLRKTLFNFIVQDIKNVNAKQKNLKLNTVLQNFMYTMLRDNNAMAAKMALQIMVDLYRRNIWNDAKTVNVIATALFSPITKLQVAALKFFLGKDEDEEDSDDESDGEKAPKKGEKQLRLAERVGKKSSKRAKKLKRALAALKKQKKQGRVASFNFSAFHLLHDPQGLAEKLFQQVQVTNERFEVKLMLMNLTSRLVGIHQLCLLNFYPYLQRYLQPHQKDVTKLLTYAAQASHQMVPPDIIESVIKTIANNFITERNSPEVMTVGLNSVREVCFRCPLAMTDCLLQDLTGYKKYKNKNVVVAARSLIQLFRWKNPDLLFKKDRGRPTEAMKEAQVLEFGEQRPLDYIPGAEALKEDKDPEDQDEWESCSEEEDDDSDGSWIDVIHSSDEDDDTKDDGPAAVPPDPEARLEKARTITQTRILTQEEFKDIKKRQLQKEMQNARKHKKLAAAAGGKKRKAEDTIEIESDDEESKKHPDFVSLSNIERFSKRSRQDKQDRMASVQRGREGREKFGGGFQRKNPQSSTSNKDKKKNKAFMMMRPKVQKKKKRSFQEKSRALKTNLLKKMKSKR